MRVVANQLFKHGTDVFEAGQEYDVPDGEGMYFVLNGWADSDEVERPQDVQAASDVVAVEVQAGRHGHAVEDQEG